jgi:GT2 family glycosyltransferase
MTHTSIIIVNWNAAGYLRKCLESIAQAAPSGVVETIVVDNDSADGSPEMVERDFPWVTLVRAGANLGFARANNLAMSRASGEHLALVNSDALVHAGCLEALSERLESHAHVGVAAPRVVGGDGQLQRTCRKLPTLWNTLCRALALDRLLPGFEVFSGYEVPAEIHATAHSPEVLSGCFCMARRLAVEQIGGFDEQFFFYGEDIDWCKRFSDAGWTLAFIPQVTATHFGGGSSSKNPLRFSVEILRATLTYWRKHHGLAGQCACYALLLLHHGTRFVARSAQRLLGGSRAANECGTLEEDIVCLRWLLFGTEIGRLRMQEQ